MNNEISQPLNQAASLPIDSVDNFEQHLVNLKKLTNWDHVGILTDEGNGNTVILLTLNHKIVATIRICLEPSLMSNCLKTLSMEGETVTYRCIQGYAITSDDFLYIEAIEAIWGTASTQSTESTQSEINELFVRFEDKRKEKGRGPDFTKDTKDTVWRESFGRCMFRGCGAKLDYDEMRV